SLSWHQAQRAIRADDECLLAWMLVYDCGRCRPSAMPGEGICFTVARLVSFFVVPAPMPRR
ncbi:hypothetical protein, partial [Bifidobacterium longum]|uniref:hypothetical protein n=1 Tax=Bifidobacterium longum TaxID=216816 RepID=UPI0030EB1637